jgi:hypothetical protein
MLNWAAGKTPADTDAGIWFVALFVGDPGDDGQSGAEAAGTGYARVATDAATWNGATDASPSVLDNAAAVAFPQAGDDWSSGADFTHFALFNHATLATEAAYIGRGALTTAAPVLLKQTANFPAGALRMRGIETS